MNQQQQIGLVVSCEVTSQDFPDVDVSFAAAEMDVFLKKNEVQETLPTLARGASGLEHFQQLALPIQGNGFQLAVVVEVGGDELIVAAVLEVGFIAASERQGRVRTGQRGGPETVLTKGQQMGPSLLAEGKNEGGGGL